MFRRELMDRCWRLGSQLTGSSFGKQITHLYVPLSGTETAHYSSAKHSGGSPPCGINYGTYHFEVDILVVYIFVNCNYKGFAWAMK